MRPHRPRWMQPTSVDSHTTYTLTIFALLYLAAIIYVRQTAWRDPTSVFFQPRNAYTPRYSDLRWRESEDFLLDAIDSPPRAGRGNHTIPEICIGIPSIARKGVRYLRSALGSLLDGLQEDERDQIHIIIFFADFDPRDHPAWHEPSLLGLVDQVITYDLPDSELERLRHMDSRHKGMFDFRYVLSACHETGAPYVTLMEDDVLAVDGWFPRTISGLDKMERAVDREGGNKDWLYLRLFYTEEYLGWNGEFVREHILWSLALIAATAVLLYSTRTFSTTVGPHLSHSLILSISCICVPLCITFFFLAGRVTLLPLSHGVQKMDKYGCCSQGLVFNGKQTKNMLQWLRDTPSGLFFDMKVEQYADEHPHLHRYALIPPVLQHMGVTSSTPNESLKAEIARKIWSFEFELYDPHGSLGNDARFGHHPKEELV